MNEKIFLFILIIPLNIFSQQNSYINSPENIKKFADFLFCSKDYLRSVFEYEKYLKTNSNDTVEFKIGLAYSKMGKFQETHKIFSNIKFDSEFYDKSRLENLRSIFLLGNFHNFRTAYLTSTFKDQDYFLRAKKLFYFSYFFQDKDLPDKNNSLKIFNGKEKKAVLDFYEREKKSPFKKPVLAAIISAIIPGSGKIYTEEYGDGITAFLATGLFTYLTVLNFNANHNFRAWIFAGAAAFFYTGNIYGSAASAQIYNAGIKFNFENDLKVYLNEQNYFLKPYNFCD